MSNNPLPKIDVANQLLRKGSLFVHLDPRVQDVVVPPWLRHQAQLVLQVGLDMPIPIHDLQVNDTGISGTLSFSRTPFTCVMPWNSVFALVGDEGRGMVWPESMPAEIVAEVEREEARSAARRAEQESGVPTIARIKSTGIPPLPASAKTAPRKTKSGKALPPYLRVVK